MWIAAIILCVLCILLQIVLFTALGTILCEARDTLGLILCELHDMQEEARERTPAARGTLRTAYTQIGVGHGREGNPL